MIFLFDKDRKNNKLSAYYTFIDTNKVFSCLNREFVLYKYIMYTIDGKLFKSINGVYNEYRLCININNMHTPFLVLTLV